MQGTAAFAPPLEPLLGCEVPSVAAPSLTAFAASSVDLFLANQFLMLRRVASSPSLWSSPGSFRSLFSLLLEPCLLPGIFKAMALAMKY